MNNTNLTKTEMETVEKISRGVVIRFDGREMSHSLLEKLRRGEIKGIKAEIDINFDDVDREMLRSGKVVVKELGTAVKNKMILKRVKGVENREQFVMRTLDKLGEILDIKVEVEVGKIGYEGLRGIYLSERIEINPEARGIIDSVLMKSWKLIEGNTDSNLEVQIERLLKILETEPKYA